MKKIFIPVAIVILVLAIAAVILSRTSSNSGGEYHTHADGSTHYDSVETTTTQAFHTHANGEIHYGDH